MDSFHGIFTAEEDILKEGEGLLASNSFSSAGDRDNYERLLLGYKTLLAQMKHMVRISDRMEGELNRTSARLEELSNMDPLTGLYNRRYFDMAMLRDWNRAIRMRSPITVAMMDIDHFKAYNDEYGHLEGDACLRAVGAIIADELKRPGDWPARYGGEEFVICFPDTEAEGGAHVCQRIARRIADLGAGTEGLKGTITLSVGIVSMVPDLRAAWVELIKAADEALYRAKSDGRDCIRFAPSGRP